MVFSSAIYPFRNMSLQRTKSFVNPPISKMLNKIMYDNCVNISLTCAKIWCNHFVKTKKSKDQMYLLNRKVHVCGPLTWFTALSCSGRDKSVANKNMYLKNGWYWCNHTLSYSCSTLCICPKKWWKEYGRENLGN